MNIHGIQIAMASKSAWSRNENDPTYHCRCFRKKLHRGPGNTTRIVASQVSNHPNSLHALPQPSLPRTQSPLEQYQVVESKPCNTRKMGLSLAQDSNHQLTIGWQKAVAKINQEAMIGSANSSSCQPRQLQFAYLPFVGLCRAWNGIWNRHSYDAVTSFNINSTRSDTAWYLGHAQPCSSMKFSCCFDMLQPWLCVTPKWPASTKCSKRFLAVLDSTNFPSCRARGGDCMWPTQRYCAEISYVQIPLPALKILPSFTCFRKMLRSVASVVCSCWARNLGIPNTTKRMLRPALSIQIVLCTQRDIDNLYQVVIEDRPHSHNHTMRHNGTSPACVRRA